MNRSIEGARNRKLLLEKTKKWDALGDEVKKQDSDESHPRHWESKYRRSVFDKVDEAKQAITLRGEKLMNNGLRYGE